MAQQLTQLTQLKHLTVADASNLTDIGICLLTCLRGLTFLWLDGCGCSETLSCSVDDEAYVALTSEVSGSKMLLVCHFVARS